MTGHPSLLRGVTVPRVVSECSSRGVLTTEWLDGAPIDRVFGTAPQDVRDSLARRMLRLTLWELSESRLMQSDPNWGNYFFDQERDLMGLLDFGATREYASAFVDDYVRLVWAAAERDEDAIVEGSCRLGFFTGHENASMVQAHVNSGLVIGEPFASDVPYDYKRARISARVTEHAAVFAKQRLSPPPDEAYSLHRKLVGAFLMCIRMGAVFPGRDLLAASVARHRFTTPPFQGLSAREALDRKAAGALVCTKTLAEQEQAKRDELAANLGLPPSAVLPENVPVRDVVGVGFDFLSDPPMHKDRKMTV